MFLPTNQPTNKPTKLTEYLRQEISDKFLFYFSSLLTTGYI